MAAQKGMDMLLKYNTSGSSYATVAGLRSTSITLNDETVDVTTKSSNGHRALLAGGGVNSVSISASGVWTSDASEEAVRTAFLAQQNTSDGSTDQSPVFKNFQMFIPDFGTLTGSFAITSLEYAGEYNGEVTFSISLESNGYIAYAS